MYYSGFCIIALIHHIIINYDILKNGGKDSSKGPHYRYRQFLFALLAFYVTDLLWGFAEQSGILILAYVDTMLFFATMAFSVLFWTRYVVAFLDKSGRKAKVFLGAGWAILTLVLFLLVVNIFNPTIFSFTEENGYVPETGRYFILAAQFLMFLVTSVYSLVVSAKTQGRERVHYLAICLSGAVMAFFIGMQVFDAFYPYYTIGCFFANCLVHVFVEEDEKKEQDRITANAQKEKERYSQIASSLAAEYDAIYYIDIESGEYMEISSSESYKSLNIPLVGTDFYADTLNNIKKYAHPDDRMFAESMYHKEAMLSNLKGRNSYSYKYRIMIGDEARYYRFDVMLSEDGEHFVLCDKDIQDTITAETALLEKQKASITFSQIAESLASNYDLIYYVDMDTEEYVGYTSHNIYGGLKVDETGTEFFKEATNNITVLIHPGDRERMRTIMNRDYLLTALEEKKQFTFEYRLIIDNRPQYTRFSARKSSDGRHMIIGVENIEAEVRKEKEHLRALNTEKELARKDELTGTRNKTAFIELEQSVQETIDNGIDYLPFAIAICDLNNLKKINDTEGHKAGDEYIKASAKLLCDTFDHSPVFRIGGDEFAIFLRGSDYESRKNLVEGLKKTIIENRDKNEGPVIAVGMVEYDPKLDSGISGTVDRADRQMYENKRELKGLAGGPEE